MTTPYPSEPDAPERRRWAASVLGVGPEAAPAEVRARLFRRLEEEDFVPPLAWHQALWLFQRPSIAASSVVAGQAQLEEEARLRTEVEAFAAGFFTLPVAERRRRLAHLIARCAHVPPLAARLWELSAGVAVDVTAFQDANFRVNWLARYVCDLLVCRPLDRPARRQALVQSMTEEKMGLWEAAARRLQKRYRPVAALEWAWIDELANWSQRQRRLAKARRRPHPRARSASPGRSLQATGTWGGVWVVVLIVSSVIRLASNSHRPETPTRSFTPSVPSRPDGWPRIDPDVYRQTAPSRRGWPTTRMDRRLPGEPGDPKSGNDWLPKWLEAAPAERTLMESERDNAPKSTPRSPSTGKTPR